MFALIYASLIGVSRIYLHVHYATDVIVGMVVGIIIAKIVVVVSEKVYAKFQNMLDGVM